MIKLFDTYLEYLTNHPDTVNSIILWTITMFFYYFILMRYKTKMIEGASGGNFWESPEQWGYLWLYLSGPITAYSAFFKAELPVYVWWFNIGVTGYTIGGRWIFQWLLALRSGSTRVETDTEKENEKPK